MNGFRIVCAWCCALLGLTGDGSQVSHGICPRCRVEVLRQPDQSVWEMWIDYGGGD